MAILRGRANSTTCYDSFNQFYNCQTGWSSWGRWLSIGAVVVAAVLMFFLFSCLTHRYRHRKGLQPYKGTSWIGKTIFGHNLSKYNAQDQQQQQTQFNSDNQVGLPPSYRQTGAYYEQNSGYIEDQQGQQNMIGLQLTPTIEKIPSSYRLFTEGSVDQLNATSSASVKLRPIPHFQSLAP